MFLIKKKNKKVTFAIFKNILTIIISFSFIFSFVFIISCKGEAFSIAEKQPEEIEKVEIEETSEAEEKENIEGESKDTGEELKDDEEKPQDVEKSEDKVLTIESPAFKENEMIPLKYTCDGENINPPFAISGVPEEALSLALIVDDPDAPGKTWVHWTLWNISPQTEEIAENSVPEDAVEGVTDFGAPGYGGPCPPSEIHSYVFKLFALDIASIDLESSSKVEDLYKAIEGHILGTGELIGLYGKK